MKSEHLPKFGSAISRRQALGTCGATLILPFLPSMATGDGDEKRESVRLGIIADLHHGLEPTAMRRLEAFLEAVDKRSPTAIVQLGDFNYGTGEADACMTLWRRFDGPRYHVLGNHDMDRNTKEHMVAYWGMPGRYYAFDRGGFHFVVLDRNNLKTPEGYRDYSKSNYFAHPTQRGHADTEQLEWLAADLARTELPTVVFVHQGLGVVNEPYPQGDPRAAIENILDEANRKTGGRRVIACFCGHHHVDRHNRKNGIHYIWVNSASYFWVGEKYGRMAPYRDALYAFVTFHPEGRIEIEGRQSAWVSPSPSERGYPNAESLTPSIVDRELRTRGSA